VTRFESDAMISAGICSLGCKAAQSASHGATESRKAATKLSEMSTPLRAER
jgi:hypothetical protein